MQIFDFEFLDYETLDVTLELKDGKLLTFNEVHFSRYDHSVKTDALMDYHCTDPDFNEIEYHPTVTEIVDIGILITNFLNNREHEDLSYMLPDYD